MEQKTSQSAVADDVCLCFWVCIEGILWSGVVVGLQYNQETTQLEIKRHDAACLCAEDY